MAGTTTVGALTPPRRISIGQLRGWAVQAPLFPLAILAIVMFAAVFAPLIAQHDPVALNIDARLTPPFWQDGGTPLYLLGTDAIGRDVLSRLIYGARISLIVASITIFVSGTIGVTLGVASGYFGGALDRIIMRIVDIQLSVPSLLFAVALAGILNPGIENVLIILIIFNWAGFARLTRGEAMALRERDFVALAKVAGCSSWRIIFRHLMPNLMNTVIVLATLDVGRIIIFEASLSFLGLGVQNPTPAWGSMLADGRAYIIDAWWLAVFPGVALLLTCLSANLIGDWLRDALDPKLRNL